LAPQHLVGQHPIKDVREGYREVKDPCISWTVDLFQNTKSIRKP